MKIQTIETGQEIILDEIIKGLSKSQKTLPSKLFYDEKGSLLFDEICKLDEYYLTRTEIKIMQDNIEEIASFIGEKKVLVELGSGSSIKIRLLIEHLPDLVAYIPIDISEEHLIKSNKILRDDYPELEIYPLIADYTEWFDLPEINKDYNSIEAYYPGSTIGNFAPGEARAFLERINKICGKESGLLIGIDLKKEKQIINKAYNDDKGITAEFNLNILDHINEIFNADFNTNNFNHCAFYNEEAGRIEMHLVSSKPQTVSIGDNKFSFEKGESILTEYSYKYSLEDFAELIKGLYSVEKAWTDKNNFFSVQFLRSV
jgi:L-histidine Nalpha-methyltransferase